MKRFFRFVMAAAVIFSAVSCAKEDISSSIGGGEVEITFTANLADMGTRAYGEANNVNVVYLGIYDKDGDYLDDLTDDDGYPVDPIKHTASIPVVLLKDKTYDLVFWAQSSEAPNNCYAMNWTERKMTVTYGSISQDDKRDAFFLVDNEFVAGDEKNPEFRLYRPFAQLNAGLSDDEVTKIGNNGVDVSKIKSQVKVKNVANVLNLVDEADDNVATDVEGEVEAEFTIALKPEEALKVSEVDYEYLSMNYLLVNKKQNVTAEYIFTDLDGTTYTRKYDNVPLQRNYRTNIVGNLLSSEYDFNVVIVPGFNEPANNYVTTIEDLQLILDNAKANEVTKVVLGADMKGDVTVLQKEGVDIIIDGNEKKYKFDGTIKIHNGSNYNNGTLTIQKVAFETSTAALNFVMPNDFGVKDGVTRRYSNNVTVKYCSFTATGAAENTAVGVQAKNCKDLKMLYCTGNNLHSLLQAQSCGENVEVKDCKINGKNGVAFKQVRNAVVEDCTINAAAYGIRFDGNTDNYGIVVKNNKVTALQPLIVRKMTGANNTIALSENELNVVDAIYQIVITNGSDDEAYVYPTGTYTITGHDGCTTYPVADKESLAAAVANPLLPVVEVEGDVENVGLGFDVARDAVLDFNGNKLNAGSDANTKWYAIQANGDDNEIIIKNAHFTRAGISAGNGAVVVFENGAIYHNPDRSSRYIFYAYGEGSTITIKDGTFTNDRPNNSFFCATNKATIIVEGGNFGGSASTKKVVLAEEGKVIIKGGTFNFDPTAWLAEGYSTYKEGSIWKVVYGSVANNPDSLNSQLTNGATVNLSKNVDYGTVTAGELKNVTINGAEGAVMIFKTDADSKLENVTLNGVNFKYTGATLDCGIVIDANAQIDNLVIDGCTVVGTGEKKGRGLSGLNNNATIVIKNTTFKDLGYPIYAWGGYKALTIEKCTFDNIKSWAIMPQSGFDGDLTVTDCEFKNCLGGGLIKAGTLTAGHTFTFTNNTVTGCTVAGDHNWFQFNVSAGTSVISGNTKDGADWTPGVADGLK